MRVPSLPCPLKVLVESWLIPMSHWLPRRDLASSVEVIVGLIVVGQSLKYPGPGLWKEQDCTPGNIRKNSLPQQSIHLTLAHLFP